MLSKCLGNSYKLSNVYIKEVGTVAGKLEAEGLIKECFDKTYDDHHIGELSYELAEKKMLKEAIEISHQKAKITGDMINLFIGGDLNNQITTSNYQASHFDRPFYGIYSACSTVGQGIQIASLLVESKQMDCVNVFVASHNATAERQFRYPVEYGVQKPITSTFTATGAVSVIVTNQPNKVRVESITLGCVTDMKQTDPNDMGRVMAPAAFSTLQNHLKDLDRTADYYDLIVTGDLSAYGKTIMKALMEKVDIKPKEYNDCGCMLYNDTQDVFQGGSGPTCSGLVTFGHLYKELLKGTYKRILVLPTGALLSPVMANQKLSIPCISHAFCLEVC